MTTVDTPATVPASERYDALIAQLRDELTPDQFRLVLQLDGVVGERLHEEHALADHIAVVRDVKASLDRHGLL